MTDQGSLPRDTSFTFVALGRAGLAALARNLIPFLKIAAIPLVLVFMLSFASHIFAGEKLRPFTQLLVERICYTLFGMAWLGFLLLPADSRRHWLPRWSPQHFVFLGYMLLIGALQLVLSEAVTMAGALLAATVSLPVLVLFFVSRLPVEFIHCCLGLAFCALAVARPGGPFWSWRLIGWKAMKMLVIVTVGTVSLIYIGSLISNFVIGLPAAFGFMGILAAIPRGIANYAAYALTLGVFAFAYRQLTGWAGNQQEILERFE